MRNPPGHDTARPRRLRPALSLTAAALGLLALTGCILGPDAGEAGSGTAARPAETDARTAPATETRKIPMCVRIWSEASADSIWNCPDPRPPLPSRGPG